VRAEETGVILTHDVILREIASGRLVIDPLEADQIGPASIDLHLGDEIRVMRGGPPVIDMDEAADFRTVTEVRPLTEPYILQPGETIHGITRERIRLPPNIGGWLEGRSRYARLGLMIHVTAGFVAPGVDNRQVLEMSNVAGRPLAIRAGIRLCQIVLQRTEGEATYAGRFADQQRL
jgi:dCTP deaminase